jgi:drug/metabolite transporter (DMT)-like permease
MPYVATKVSSNANRVVTGYTRFVFERELMETYVFVAVLLAALFHATWNTFVKVDGDRLVFMAVMMVGSGFAALITTPFFPFPATESWPYIALSILFHDGYIFFLLMAYRYGDLSHVYPLARGSAPLIVAFVSITLIGEQLTDHGLLAVIIVTGGIISLCFTRGAQNLRNPTAVVFALGTGLFLAGYTVIDGLGARLAGNAHSYAAWTLALEVIPFLAFVIWRRKMAVLPQMIRIWKPALLLGGMSLAAYWTVIWAMTVAPIALVATLRETGIIFALIFGIVFLKERLSLVRLVAVFTTLVGAAMLKMSRL